MDAQIDCARLLRRARVIPSLTRSQRLCSVCSMTTTPETLIEAIVALCDDFSNEVRASGPSAHDVVTDLYDCAIGDGDDGGWTPRYRDLLVEVETLIEKMTDVEPGSDAMVATLDELLDSMDLAARNAND